MEEGVEGSTTRIDLRNSSKREWERKRPERRKGRSAGQGQSKVATIVNEVACLSEAIKEEAIDFALNCDNFFQKGYSFDFKFFTKLCYIMN